MSKKTTAIIIESKNDYLIGVKKNQSILYHAIESIIGDRNKQSSWYMTIEKNRGRSELRSIIVSNSIETISKDWVGLQQIISVHRMVKEKGKVSAETAYFISSRNGNAFLYEQGVRSHWEIENSLHWVKDVTLKEDASKIKRGNAPQNLSTLRNIGINIFRKNNYKCIAQAIRLVANDINKLGQLLL